MSRWRSELSIVQGADVLLRRGAAHGPTHASPTVGALGQHREARAHVLAALVLVIDDAAGD